MFSKDKESCIMAEELYFVLTHFRVRLKIFKIFTFLHLPHLAGYRHGN